MTATFFGTVDLAQVTLYLFWLFFFGLVIYLQRENQREGYPTENEDGSDAGATFGMPEPKTYILPHGRGTYTAPNNWKEDRTFNMERVSPSAGSPYEPTGNPMLDGVGPAAYAMREDEPELDAHGEPTMRPMRMMPDYAHVAGKDPRGLPVVACDGEVVGKVSDMWVDKADMMVRYLEMDLGEGGTRVIPVPLTRITWRGVAVQSLTSGLFADIPKLKSAEQITKLEEEKVSAYIASGKLYATRARTEPVLEPVAG